VVADLAGDGRDVTHLLARIPGLSEVLQETRDAGKTWVPLAGDTPSPIRKILTTDIGWFALLDSGGGLAQYDVLLKNWKYWKFLLAENTRASRRGRNTSPRGRRLSKDIKTPVFDCAFPQGKYSPQQSVAYGPEIQRRES